MNRCGWKEVGTKITEIYRNNTPVWQSTGSYLREWIIVLVYTYVHVSTFIQFSEFRISFLSRFSVVRFCDFAKIELYSVRAYLDT